MSAPVLARALGAPRRDEGGFALLLVLIVLTAVVGLALALGREARVEVAVASRVAARARLQALLASAIDRARAQVRADDQPGDDLAAPWRDDPSRFQAIPLGDDARAWYLLTSPDPGDGKELRWGLRDEAGLLNLNTATPDQLLALGLPGLTEEVVDAIIDWRDDDDDPQPQGAESSTYTQLEPAYQAKNGPFEALEELLRVRGIDELLLYGEDRNRNGLLDPGEDDGDGSFPPDDADGQLDRGLIDYLTVFSREPNQTPDGRARLAWSGASPEDLESRLRAAGAGDAAVQRLLFVQRRQPSVNSLGELLGFPEIDEAAARAVFAEITVVDADFIPGRINVNTAPREVLRCLPGLEDADLDAILTRRLEFDSDLSSPAWLLRAIPRGKLQLIADLITTRAEQFRFQVVVQEGEGPAFLRAEVLIDRSFAPVGVLSWRDLTPLGFPFPAQRGEGLP